MNMGYAVSGAHTNPAALKTDAPTQAIWDVMRAWNIKHPVSERRKGADSPARAILSKPPR